MRDRDETIIAGENELRAQLARAAEPRLVDPPPDLVTRSLRLLPAAPPAAVAHMAARRATAKLVARMSAWAMTAGLALLALWGALGGGPRLALLFGDGSSGLSRALLTLGLLMKPLLGVIGAYGAPLFVSGLVAAAGAVFLWWWLLRRAPVYA